jgi:hypothetical protein
MTAVGLVMAPGAPWHNRFAARLARAVADALAADPRVALQVSADLDRAPLPADRAVVLNLSAQDDDAVRRRLPAGARLVTLRYLEQDHAHQALVALPLPQLWARPALVPGQRAVLAPPALLALELRDHAGGLLTRWEGRAHRKRAGRAVRALLQGAPALVADALATHPLGTHARAADACPAHGFVPVANGHPPAHVAGGAVPTALRYGAHLLRDTVVRRWRPDEAEQWAIGVAPVDGGMDPRPEAIRWLHPPADRGFADPFLFTWEGTRWLFFEEVPHRGGLGVIAALPLDADGHADPEARRVVLRHAHHLSFPTLHAVAGELYLLCEEGSAGLVRLHRCVRYPDRWEPLPPLIAGVAGADPVLWHHEGHWYLFVTDARGGNHDNHLHLYVAPSLHGPWRRHRASPLRHGLDGSRMAGAILEAPGGPYRLGQACARRYGGAIHVFAIEAITPDDYRERFVRSLDPVRGSRYPLARHTHARLDGLLALDGVRTMPLQARVRPAR